MRVRGAAVDLQLLGHRFPEPVLGQHALHRPLDDALGMRPDHRLGVDLAQPADVAGVPAVLLVSHLAPGQVHLRGVDDDHVIADVEVRNERLLVLPAKD